MNSVVHLSMAIYGMYGSTIPQILLALQQVQPQPGDYKASARGSDFLNWFLCDGRSLSRQDFPALFDVIGTMFGSECPTTFRLPDFRGRVIGQPGHGPGLTLRSLGDVTGAETHVLSEGEMPSHTHTGTTATAGSHTHTITDPGHTHTQTTVNDDFNSSGSTPPGFAADSAGTRTWNNIQSATTGISVNSAGAHTHGFTTASTGAGGAHNNMQPTLFGANVFIWVGQHEPITTPQ